MDTLTQACELGLVTRDEVERGLVEVRPGPRSGRLAVLVRGRVVALIQEPRIGVPVTLQRALLSVLDDQDLGPHVLASADGRLWTEPVPGRSLGQVARPDDQPALVELTDACVALGAALAAVHRLPPARISVPAARRPMVAHRSLGGRDTSLAAEILHAVSADPALQVAVEAVGQRWAERHWTLGRIDPADVIVDSSAGWRVRFANVGEIGVGCADFDVAACLASIARVAAPATSVAWLSGHFWNSYRRAGGPGQIHPQVQALYAVDAAWRASEQEDRPAEVVRWWLRRAHEMVARSTASTALAA